MQRTGLGCVALLSVFWMSRVSGQTPSFSLSFEAPAGVVGEAGAAQQYTATGKLTTTGLTDTDPGAQGWSLSMNADGGGSIVGATTAGTILDTLFNEGFNRTELTSGPGNEGAVSAVVLTLTESVTLPPSGTVEVIRLTVEATVPEPVVDDSGDPSCEPVVSRVLFVNGRRGGGQPVDNKVTYKGETSIPSLDDATTSVCPRVVKPLVFRTDVLSSGSSAGEKEGTITPWTIEVPVGAGLVEVTAGVLLLSNLPDDPDPEVTDGAQGWSMSVRTEPCFNIQSVTTAGTAADSVANGGFFTDGFNKTQVVDPGKNGGMQGAVSAVVLSLTEGRFLPPIGEYLLLKVSGRIDAASVTGPGETTSPCLITPADPNGVGLVGSGQPVKTAVTVEGSTRKPGICGAEITLAGATEGSFVRGNANDDGKNDIADAVWIVNQIFRNGTEATCADAADANNDAMVDISDALYLIGYQFQGQLPPPAPFPDCGTDPEGDGDGLPCDVSQADC